MRWWKFNAVGALGMVVQLAALGFFVHLLGLHYLLATALAVEAAVLHNFVWHRRWTWAERGPGLPAWGMMLLRFNLTNGMVSLAGNILFMRLLAGAAGIEPVIANFLSILLCSLVNFLLCDRFVFISRGGASPSEHRNAGPG